MGKLRQIRDNIVPGTVVPATLGMLGMIGVPVVTTSTGWDDTTIGGWVGPALVVAIFFAAFRQMNKARKRWDAEKAAASFARHMKD